jgi:hypothetical protein
VNAFEYLSVLISIILALGMTRVLAGVGEMLQARSRRHIYWVHAIWIFNLFLWLVVAWWIFYRWRDQQPWTFFLFVFVVISPTILYLASLLLFPREGDVDLAIVTRDGWRWIVDTHKNDGKRYIVQSDELLSAFLALEKTLHDR